MAERQSIVRNLSVVYEDSDIIVYTAPNEDQLKQMIIDILRESGGALTIKDIHRILSGIASEDKIRSALNDLVDRNIVMMNRDGAFYLANSMVDLSEEEFSDEAGYEELEEELEYE